MVLINLQICATLEDVKILSCKKPDFVWHLKFKCSNCNEVSAAWQNLSLDKPLDTAGGRGATHFGSKCKCCKKDIRITIMDDMLRDYIVKDSGAFQPVATFDCRGAEPVEYQFGNDWIVKTERSSFEDVDLTEDGGDWSDWDDNLKKAVSISNAKFTFVKIKQKTFMMKGKK